MEVHQKSPEPSSVVEDFSIESFPRRSIGTTTTSHDVIKHKVSKGTLESSHGSSRSSHPPIPTRSMTWCTFIASLQLNNVPCRRLIFEGQGDPVGKGTYFEVWRYLVKASSEVRIFRGQDRDLAIPEIVALKRILPRFNESSGALEIRDERQLKAVALEIEALSTPILRRHENIITLIAVCWESRGSFDAVCWPTLVLEFCQFTLSDYQRQASGCLPSEAKNQLISGIGQGLTALHFAGFIHGDIKSENILIRIADTGRAIPKLGDFGSSVYVSDNHERVWIGGTSPWRAPECSLNDGMIRPLNACLTDYYSFGLLIWRVIWDDRNPFAEHFSSLSRYSQTLEDYTDSLKKNDLVIPMAKADIQHMLTGESSTMEIMQSMMVALLHSDIDTRRTSIMRLSLIVAPAIVPHSIADESPSTLDGYKFLRKAFQIPHIHELNQHEQMDHDFYPGASTRKRIFDEIHTLVLEWETNIGDPTCLPCCSLTTLDHPELSGGLDVQTVIKSLLQDSTTNHTCGAVCSDNSKLSFPSSANIFNAVNELATCYIEGYGTVVDAKEAFAWFVKGARWGSPNCQRLLMSIARNLKQPIPQQLPLRKWLVQSIVQCGSSVGKRDLSFLNLDLAKITQETRRRIFDGITIDVNNLTRGLEEGDDWSYQDGNTMLHYAATVWTEPVKDIRRIATQRDWVASAPRAMIDMNVRNDEGCTPLMLACRAGRFENICLLVELGAGVKTATPDMRDTALHWLMMHEHCQPLIPLLVSCGADVNGQSRQVPLWPWIMGSVTDLKRSYSLVGSPLNWAVGFRNLGSIEMLLSLGADMNLKNEVPHNSPFEDAVFSRNADIISAFLKRSDAPKITKFVLEGLVSTTDCWNKCFGQFSDEDTIRTFRLLAARFHRDAIEDVNDFFYRSLCLAMKMSPFPIIEALTDHYEDCLRCCSSSETCAELRPFANHFWAERHILDIGIFRNDARILEYLLAKGARTSDFHPDGYSLVHTFAMSEASRECLQILLSTGIGINEEMASSGWTAIPWTPFALAVLFSRIDTADLILEHMTRAEIDEINAPMKWYTEEEQRMTMFGTLIQQGTMLGLGCRGLEYLLALKSIPIAFVVRPSDQLTALHIAVRSHDSNEGVFHEAGSLSTFRLLLRHFSGPDCIDAQNVHGITPLYMASYFGKLEEVIMLIEAGADMNFRVDLDEATAIDAAFFAMPTGLVKDDPTKEMRERFHRRRNAIAVYMRRRKARSYLELVTGETLGNYIPYPQESLEMSDLENWSRYSQQ